VAVAECFEFFVTNIIMWLILMLLFIVNDKCFRDINFP